MKRSHWNEKCVTERIGKDFEQGENLRRGLTAGVAAEWCKSFA